MKLKAVYRGRLWDVKTLFLQDQGSTGARLERGSEVEFPSYGQFILLRPTGLLDKNGREIYENDIIQFYVNGQLVHELVRWDEAHTGFLPFSQPYGLSEAWVSPHLVEVVETV